MNNNWTLWQYFLTVAERGSLNKAAQSLGISQPTLSRQIHSLEVAVGDSLFDRSTQGIKLTALGEKLIPNVLAMSQQAAQIARLCNGESEQIQGNLRLSVNEIFATDYLANLLKPYLETYPKVNLQIHVSNAAANLDKRDADLAIRMFSPTQQDVIAKRVGTVSGGFFASQDYLERHGTPADPMQLFEHRVAGMDRSPEFVDAAKKMGFNVKNEDFVVRTDFYPLHLAMAQRGAAIAVIHGKIAKRLGLVQVLPFLQIPELPVYLVCHRDVQHNRRIRSMMDFLSAELPKAL
ncbi:MAG: LysR family transcriptional regulator [Gammaproteobacteria bacterium]|nr:LysR family transcriptional regulator [Gammaproteobacteria bacterium]